MIWVDVAPYTGDVELFERVFSWTAVIFEGLGAAAMVVGFVVALTVGARSLARGEGGTAAFTTLRTTLGGAILLGLEILVAADLIRTITSNPSVEDAVILGLIVVIRTILSISIQIEIEGVLPWKRALLESGASVVTGQIKRDAQAARALRSGESATESAQTRGREEHRYERP